MLIDDMDGSDMTCSRAAWKNEIEEWLRRLKTTEKDLGLKEKELRQREIILHQREKSLEEQFHVVVSVLYFLTIILPIVARVLHSCKHLLFVFAIISHAVISFFDIGC